MHLRFVHGGREIRIRCYRLGDHVKRRYEIIIAHRSESTDFACSLFDLFGGLFRDTAAADVVPAVESRMTYEVNGPELACEFEAAVNVAKRKASALAP
jgi:hypothetical protein